MKNFFSRKKGFTLVEMLIVIVIIGLLAAALIPKIVGMQAKARDTTRSADIRSIKLAFTDYYSSFGSYPDAGNNSVNSLTGIASILGGRIPSDPQGTRSFSGMATTVTGGSYGYELIRRDGIVGGSYVIMAGMEELGAGTNRVVTTPITDATEIKTVYESQCKKVTRDITTSTGTNQNCTANGDVLRNIVAE